MTGYAFHPEALLDPDEIWTYISANSFDAADRVIHEILTRIETIVPFPNQGHKRPQLTARPLRFVVVRDYLVAYAPEEQPLLVVAVIHGRRNPRVLAAVLRGRA